MSNGNPQDPVPMNDPAADEQSDGKFALIEVPNFNASADPAGGMTSYLRLGAAPKDWKAWEKSKSAKGQKLAEEIYLSGPPGGHLNPIPPEGQPQIGTTPAEERSPEHPFIDDMRFRGDGAPHDLSEGARVAESKLLHTKGGWRDHSDGNRISTTYGDKIEVIRGNYKMVVLGRQDDPSTCTGWDNSGQHIQDFGYTMPGASVRVEWMQDYEGVWHLENSTENVRQSSRNAGTFRTENWGELMETITGQPKAAAMADFYMEDVNGTSLPRGNPKIYERTWAKLIETSTGSAAVPVPIINEETWADVVTTLTQVISSTDTTIAQDTLKSTTEAQTITDSTKATTIESKTEATTMSDSTTATTVTETSSLGAITINSQIGASTEMSTIGASTAMSMVGANTELSMVGANTELSLTGVNTSLSLTGVDIELTIKALQLQINLAVLELTFGLSAALNIHIGGTLEVEWPKKWHVSGDEGRAAISRRYTAVMTFLGL